MKKRNKIQKYATVYSGMGMCFAMALVFVFGPILFSDDMLLGISLALPIGTGIGMAFGEDKDKRLEKHMMKISRIRFVQGSSYKLIYALDKHGAEKVYKVNEKRMKQEKFSVGDRVAEGKEGILVSLERKSYCM